MDKVSRALDKRRCNLETQRTTKTENPPRLLHRNEKTKELITFSFRLRFAIVSVLVLGLDHHLGLVDHKLGRGLILADAGAAHVSSVGDPGPEDDQPVHALVQLLDLDPVVLADHVAGHSPLGVALLVQHLTLEGHLLLLAAGLVLQGLEELVHRSNSQLHLGLVTVGLTLEQTLGLAGDILDDKEPLPAVLFLADLVEPVWVTLEDLNAIEVPIDDGFLDIDLAVNLDSPVLDITEALELSCEVARLGCKNKRL